MRHIPEEELHAYLDQALSRGQCVEIECHLAECWRCRRERDTLASLRDRTTALLGVLGPRRLVVPPPVDAIRRQSRRLAFRRSVRWTGTWAAALGSAVFGGFALHSYLDRQSPARVAVASEEPAALLGGAPATPSPGAELPARHAVAPDRITLAPAEPTLVATPEIVRPRTTPDPLEPALRSSGRRVLDIRSLGSRRETDLYLSGLWKTVPWDEAEALTHNLVPHVTGLPITEVRVQPRSADERPIVIVSQQHASGVIIRTIEGPVDEVAGLVTEQLDRGDGLETSLPVRTPPEYLGIGSEIPRRSLRVMTVIGRLPVDTLNALRERLALQ